MWPSPVPAGERDKLFKVGLVDKNGIVQPINSKTALKKVMKDCKHLRALTMRALLGMGTLAQKDAKLEGMVSAATVRKVCEQLTLSRGSWTSELITWISTSRWTKGQASTEAAEAPEASEATQVVNTPRDKAASTRKRHRQKSQ